MRRHVFWPSRVHLEETVGCDTDHEDESSTGDLSAHLQMVRARCTGAQQRHATLMQLELAIALLTCFNPTSSAITSAIDPVQFNACNPPTAPNQATTSRATHGISRQNSSLDLPTSTLCSWPSGLGSQPRRQQPAKTQTPRGRTNRASPLALATDEHEITITRAPSLHGRPGQSGCCARPARWDTYKPRPEATPRRRTRNRSRCNTSRTSHAAHERRNRRK